MVARGVEEPLHVRAEAAELDGEHEAGRHGVAPALEDARVRKTIEAAVDLDGVEVLRVVGEPRRRRQAHRVETPLPARVDEPRRPDPWRLEPVHLVGSPIGERLPARTDRQPT